jgi:hypothetical protein
MGRFFRDFDDKHQSSSLTVLLLGILMFSGMAWLLAAVYHGSPVDSVLEFIANLNLQLPWPPASEPAVQPPAQ